MSSGMARMSRIEHGLLAPPGGHFTFQDVILAPVHAPVTCRPAARWQGYSAWNTLTAHSHQGREFCVRGTRR